MCTLLKFPAEIHADLGHYVYRLVDPRDGMTFYVGKGQKDRVFDHMRGAISADVDENGLENAMPQIDEVSEKVSVIGPRIYYRTTPFSPPSGPAQRLVQEPTPKENS